MKVSTRGDYASRAFLSLALHGDGQTPRSVRDIAEQTDLPQPYLEQILLALKGAGLVESKRGVGGGYVLAREPKRILLSQIVSAVDGPIVGGDFGEPRRAMRAPRHLVERWLTYAQIPRLLHSRRHRSNGPWK